jgi:hypothetical protein
VGGWIGDLPCELEMDVFSSDDDGNRGFGKDGRNSRVVHEP